PDSAKWILLARPDSHVVSVFAVRGRMAALRCGLRLSCQSPMFSAEFRPKADLDKLYGADVFCQSRATSATLKACATHPRGTSGASPSKISLIDPMHPS